MPTHFKMELNVSKPIPRVKDNPCLNAIIRDTLKEECIRIAHYARDHENFNDRTGQLDRAVKAWSLRHRKFGYTMLVGIQEQPLILDRWGGPEIINGKTTLDLASWLTLGTRQHRLPGAGFYFFRGYGRYKKGNTRGKARGWWRLNHVVAGIDPRTNFIKNAFSRTRKIRDANFKKAIADVTKLI